MRRQKGVRITLVMVGMVVMSILSQPVAAKPGTLEEQFERQEESLWKLPRCGRVNDSIKAWDAVMMNPSDDVLGEILLTYNVPVTRCRGLCGGQYRCCLPTRTVNKTFVVLYLDMYGDQRYAAMKIEHHEDCQCQDPLW